MQRLASIPKGDACRRFPAEVAPLRAGRSLSCPNCRLNVWKLAHPIGGLLRWVHEREYRIERPTHISGSQLTWNLREAEFKWCASSSLTGSPVTLCGPSESGASVVAVYGDWNSVIARSLAFLCLHYGDMRDKTVLEQAEFLDRLGMPRSETAELLGSSERSLKELARQRDARAKKKSKKTK